MFLVLAHFLWLYLIVPKTTIQDSMSTEKMIALTCAMPAKITLLKHLAKHIDFVVKCQVNVAFIISAHIIKQIFLNKKINHDSQKKKKGNRTQKKTNKQKKPPTHNFHHL